MTFAFASSITFLSGRTLPSQLNSDSVLPTCPSSHVLLGRECMCVPQNLLQPLGILLSSCSIQNNFPFITVITKQFSPSRKPARKWQNNIRSSGHYEWVGVRWRKLHCVDGVWMGAWGRRRGNGLAKIKCSSQISLPL